MSGEDAAILLATRIVGERLPALAQKRGRNYEALRKRRQRHGYRLSPGTLYPPLRDLEQTGYLARRNRTVGGRVRKYYTITRLGRTALRQAKRKIVELVAEVLANQPSRRG